MKGIGYCRVSTREQAIEGYSLDTQKREIQEYCWENDIELIHTYVDSGESAFKKDIKERTQGRLVLEHIYNKDIDCVVIVSDDRMFRNIEHSLALDAFAEQNNVKILYTRQTYYDELGNSTRFLLKSMNAVINQYYSELYAEKVKGGLINKIKNTEWVGQAPYGYSLVNSHLQVNEEQAPILQLIFSMYLDGKGAERICNYLNENNYKPPKGKHWSKNSVNDMLKNQAYTGVTVFNRRAPKRSKKKFNPESEWLIIENTHTPLISKEDYDKAQELRAKKKKQNGVNNIDRTMTSLAPLAGLVFCDNCHQLYLPTTGSSKKQGKIHYYACGSRKRHGKSVCDTHMIPAELLEKFVLYRVREILTSKMYQDQFEQQLTRELEILKSKKKDITRIKRDIGKLTTTKTKLLELIINEDDETLSSTYKEKLQETVSQLSVQNEQLKLYESIDITEEEKQLRKQFNMSKEDITYKDFQELSREQLKVFFNYLIDHIEIKEFSLPDDPKVILCITIHLKLDGYAPKYSLEYLKNIRTEDKTNKNASNFFNKNCLQNGGGEGGIRTHVPQGAS